MNPHTRWSLLLGLTACLLSLPLMARYLDVPVSNEWRPLTHFLHRHAGEHDQIVFTPDWLGGSASDQRRLPRHDPIPSRALPELPTEHDLWLYTRGRGRPAALSRWPHQVEIEALGGTLIHASTEGPPEPRDALLLRAAQRPRRREIQGRDRWGVDLDRGRPVVLDAFLFGQTLRVWFGPTSGEGSATLVLQTGEDIIKEIPLDLAEDAWRSSRIETEHLAGTEGPLSVHIDSGRVLVDVESGPLGR